jgi:hypothetical protein
MENADYHRHLAISKSGLDVVAKSPLHYWARFLDPNRVVPEPTPAMAIGSAVHTHVLELDQWDARYVTAPEGIDRRTKAGKAEWEAFTTAATGRIVLPKADADLVMRMAHSVLAILLRRCCLHYLARLKPRTCGPMQRRGCSASAGQIG